MLRARDSTNTFSLPPGRGPVRVMTQTDGSSAAARRACMCFVCARVSARARARASVCERVNGCVSECVLLQARWQVHADRKSEPYDDDDGGAEEGAEGGAEGGADGAEGALDGIEEGAARCQLDEDEKGVGRPFLKSDEGGGQGAGEATLHASRISNSNRRLPLVRRRRRRVRARGAEVVRVGSCEM